MFFKKALETLRRTTPIFCHMLIVSAVAVLSRERLVPI